MCKDTLFNFKLQEWISLESSFLSTHINISARSQVGMLLWVKTSLMPIFRHKTLFHLPIFHRRGVSQVELFLGYPDYLTIIPFATPNRDLRMLCPHFEIISRQVIQIQHTENISISNNHKIMGMYTLPVASQPFMQTGSVWISSSILSLKLGVHISSPTINDLKLDRWCPSCRRLVQQGISKNSRERQDS